MIEIEGVRRRFGKTEALVGVDLRVAEHEVVGLLGPNGAGKTTLIRIISTLLRPDAGTVRVAGFDVVRRPVEVRGSIGLAGQHAAIDELLSGRENLEIVGRLYRLPGRAARARAAEVLERLSLTDAADRPVRTYSGGMRRRLDVGACLVGRPRVLLLDEPTTGLDPRARLELWALLGELVADGATVLLTTQYLEEADALASRIALLDRGRVVADGTPAALKERIGTDVVEVALERPEALAAAGAAVADLAVAEPSLDLTGARLSFRVPSGTNALAQTIRRLDDAGIPVADLGLHRPSLDDVFLALTTHDERSAA